MKQIPLTQGTFALVDDSDYEHYSQFNYYLHTEGYAVRDIWIVGGGKKKTVRMHREIMNTPEGMDTDHINGDRLDNRRANLRVCTRSENLRNGKKRINNTSQYKGVSFFKPIQKWRAYVTIDGKQKNLGYFKEEDKAALAYNEAAVKYYGEFAKLNEVPQ